MQLVLCSGSSRRIQILKNNNIDFIVKPAKIQEINTGNKNKVLFLNTINKLLNVISLSNKDNFFISFDTVVYCRHKILGKPDNKTELRKMLKLLSGKTHKVLTSCFIYVPVLSLNLKQRVYNKLIYLKYKLLNKNNDFNELFNQLINRGLFINKVYISKVTFKKISDYEINKYIENETSVYDASGGYKIQENGIKLIKKIKGDFYNIIGFPENFIKIIKNYRLMKYQK